MQSRLFEMRLKYYNSPAGKKCTNTNTGYLVRPERYQSFGLPLSFSCLILPYHMHVHMWTNFFCLCLHPIPKRKVPLCIAVVVLRKKKGGNRWRWVVFFILKEQRPRTTSSRMKGRRTKSQQSEIWEQRKEVGGGPMHYRKPQKLGGQPE